MREKGQNEVAKTLETPVFSRGREILTEKAKFHQTLLCKQWTTQLVTKLVIEKQMKMKLNVVQIYMNQVVA